MEGSSELTPSEMGTKDYWVSFYNREKQNFTTYGDPGDIWFGEESEERILRWLEKTKLPQDMSIVDIGCGNGMMLIAMRNEGFTNLTGLDYCENAIELAKSVAASQSIDDIKFEVADIISDKFPTKFDAALDKGTYDAISLDPDSALDKRKKYINNVADLLKDDGLLIITSCNWTEDELGDHFNEYFDHLESLPTPKYMFGGKVGNVVSSVVFKKR